MIRAVLLILLGVTLCGCSQGPGEFCTKHSDCEPPLRCTGRGGQRGVCTYPFDARVEGSAPDQRVPDQKARDAASE